MTRLFDPGDDCIGQIHDQLAHLNEIKRGMPPALGSVQLLTREQLSVLIGTAFWASLRTYEGQPIRVSLAVGAPEHFQNAHVFKTDVSYDESQIVKLAPAVPNAGCLIVSPSMTDGFHICGFAGASPGPWMDTVTIELSKPGTLRIGIGPFPNYAILQGRSNTVLGGSRIDLPDYLRRILRKGFPENDILETQAVWRECMALADVARLILDDGHGGAVLIVPDENGEWEGSLTSFPYRLKSPDTTVRDVIRQELADANTHGQAIQQLSEANIPEELKHSVLAVVGISHWGGMKKGVRAIASLAGIDGAVVVTQDLRVLGFGAKIGLSAPPGPFYIFTPEPVNQPLIASPLESLGGTRHQSAARFAAVNKNSVVLVISQDGHMSVVHWDSKIEGVAVVRNAEWLM